MTNVPGAATELQELVASNMKVDPERLVIISNQAIAQSMDPHQVGDLLDVMGISQPTAVIQEFVDKPILIDSDPESSKRLILGASAYALVAQAATGRIKHGEGHQFVDTHVTDDRSKAYYKYMLYSDEAMSAHALNRHDEAKGLVKRSIKYAYDSGSKDAVFQAKNKELFILFKSGDYKTAWHKGKALWAFMNKYKDEVPGASSPVLRRSVLIGWQSSLAELGNIKAAAAVQEIMFAEGFSSETPDEYSNRLKSAAT